jgi:hypothetical protein
MVCNIRGPAKKRLTLSITVTYRNKLSPSHCGVYQTGWTGLEARLIQITLHGMFEFPDKPEETEQLPA